MRSVFAILIVITPFNANAGAWMQEHGAWEIINSYNYFSSDTFYDSRGNNVSGSKIVKQEMIPYAEYGLTKDITVGGALSVVSFANSAALDNDDSFKLATADLFVKTPLWQEDGYIVSIQPGVKIPFEDEAAINPEGSNPIPELKLAAGYGFKFLDNYSFVELGTTYRWRNKERLEDMLKIDAALGLRVHKEIMLLTQLFHDESLGMDKSKIISGNYNLTKLQFSVAFQDTESLSYQAGIYDNIDGENTASGNGFIFSVWYKF